MPTPGVTNNLSGGIHSPHAPAWNLCASLERSPFPTPPPPHTHTTPSYPTPHTHILKAVGGEVDVVHEAAWVVHFPARQATVHHPSVVHECGHLTGHAVVVVPLQPQRTPAACHKHFHTETIRLTLSALRARVEGAVHHLTRRGTSAVRNSGGRGGPGWGGWGRVAAAGEGGGGVSGSSDGGGGDGKGSCTHWQGS
jgi:hypothetical protein